MCRLLLYTIAYVILIKTLFLSSLSNYNYNYNLFSTDMFFLCKIDHCPLCRNHTIHDLMNHFA